MIVFTYIIIFSLLILITLISIKYQGITASLTDKSIIIGIMRLNMTMEKWEKEDKEKYPRYKLIDWYLPAKERNIDLASKEVKNFINNQY